MKKILLLSMTTLLFFTNCSDDTTTESTSNFYLFEETQCANPWELGFSSPEADVIVAVESYLADLGVDVLETTVDSVGPGEICSACSCLTGRGIHVEADISHEAVLLGEGFVLE